MSETVTVTTLNDDSTFDAYVARPADTPRAAILDSPQAGSCHPHSPRPALPCRNAAARQPASCPIAP